MASKKYAKDYRLESRVQGKGRVKTEAHYCGSYYTYEAPERVARLGRRLPLLAAIATACTLGTLLPSCGYMRTLYTTIPMLVLLPSLYMLWAAFLRIKILKLPATREQRDRITNNLSGGGVLLLVTSILASLCGVAYLIWGGPQGWDYGCFVMELIRIPCAVLLFRMRKDANMTELPKEPESEPEGEA